MRVIYKISAVVGILIVLSLIFVVGGILRGWYTLKPTKADCIIVLGCKVDGSVPSAFLAARIREAERLYKAGYAKYIIASGGQGSNEEISEAEAIRRMLVKDGVPDQAVILENQSRSTWENLKNSKEKMKEQGFTSAIIVSNSFHLNRASMMAKKLGIKASSSGVYDKTHKLDEFGSFLREILATYKYYLT